MSAARTAASDAGPAPRRRRATIALFVLGLWVAACGSPAATATPSAAAPSAPSASDSDSPSGSTGPSDSSSGTVVPDSPVAGIVVSVDNAAASQVKGFTLRTNDGETVVFLLGTLENAADFAPSDLQDHQSTAAPVLVFFRPDSTGNLVVYRIEDAG